TRAAAWLVILVIVFLTRGGSPRAPVVVLVLVIVAPPVAERLTRTADQQADDHEHVVPDHEKGPDHRHHRHRVGEETTAEARLQLSKETCYRGDDREQLEERPGQLMHDVQGGADQADEPR